MYTSTIIQAGVEVVAQDVAEQLLATHHLRGVAQQRDRAHVDGSAPLRR